MHIFHHGVRYKIQSTVCCFKWDSGKTLTNKIFADVAHMWKFVLNKEQTILNVFSPNSVIVYSEL